MSEFSRRTFLKSGTAAVVAAGALAALPGAPALIGAADTQGPADVEEAQAALYGAESSAPLAEPIVAHVRDLSTGEIGFFSGTREITVIDPKLAASIFRAIR